jgi:hypothetical protein
MYWSKMSYTFWNENLKIALSKTNDYILNFDISKNDFVLNSDHQYYHQIQGKMYMTKTTSTILIIWTLKSSVAFKINKDQDWIGNIDLLLNFYHEKYIPYILTCN